MTTPLRAFGLALLSLVLVCSVAGGLLFGADWLIPPAYAYDDTTIHALDRSSAHAVPDAQRGERAGDYESAPLARRYDDRSQLWSASRIRDNRSAPNTVLPKPAVTHSKLQNIVNDLYKGTTNPTRAGTGTTADAVRNELATGQATGGTFHLQKAEQYSNALRGVLKQGLRGHDALVAQSLLDDLQRAMRGLP